MDIGRVVGSVVCTVKDPHLNGVKLLLVQIIKNGRNENVIVAGDALRVSGEGDMVYLIKSKEAAMAFRQDLMPVDAAIMGFLEQYHIKNAE